MVGGEGAVELVLGKSEDEALKLINRWNVVLGSIVDALETFKRDVEEILGARGHNTIASIDRALDELRKVSSNIRFDVEAFLLDAIQERLRALLGGG